MGIMDIIRREKDRLVSDFKADRVAGKEAKQIYKKTRREEKIKYAKVRAKEDVRATKGRNVGQQYLHFLKEKKKGEGSKKPQERKTLFNQ